MVVRDLCDNHYPWFSFHKMQVRQVFKWWTNKKGMPHALEISQAKPETRPINKKKKKSYCLQVFRCSMFSG